jgi:hypothetical protein
MNRLTERDLSRIVRRVIKEEECTAPPEWLMNFKIDGKVGTSDCSNWNWRASEILFVWISLKDKMLSVTTELDLDETSKEEITAAMGVQPKTKLKTLNWVKTFSSSEEGGDLNITLNGLQGNIPWMSMLNEMDIRRIVRRVIKENKIFKDMPKNPLRKLEREIEKIEKVKSKLSGINLDFIRVETPDEELQVTINKKGQYIIQPRSARNEDDKVLLKTAESYSGSFEDNLERGIDRVISFFKRRVNKK